MKMTARGSIAALMTCMAAAGAASPAAADVPVGVPLEGVESTLGIDAPRVATGVPVPVVGAIDAPRFHTGELMPERTLPTVPLDLGLGRTLVASKVPNALGPEKKDAEGSLEAPATTMAARGPGAVLGLPLTAPDASNYGLPNVTLPKLGVVGPELVGEPSALLGLH